MNFVNTDQRVIWKMFKPIFISTRISGRYAPLILAPAEGYSQKPCPISNFRNSYSPAASKLIWEGRVHIPSKDTNRQT